MDSRHFSFLLICNISKHNSSDIIYSPDASVDMFEGQLQSLAPKQSTGGQRCKNPQEGRKHTTKQTFALESKPSDPWVGAREYERLSSCILMQRGVVEKDGKREGEGVRRGLLQAFFDVLLHASTSGAKAMHDLRMLPLGEIQTHTLLQCCVPSNSNYTIQSTQKHTRLSWPNPECNVNSKFALADEENCALLLI